MAPEQLSGQEVTARSDLYALRLVLYEIFTGQRALEASNLAELIQREEQSGIPPATAIVKSLDPKIERVISKCLKPEVDERPVSALAVAARCLAAIRSRPLAAGETPSPAMVAAAGSRDVLSLRATMAAAGRVDPLAPCGRVVVSARDPPQPRAAAEAARGAAGSRAGGARVARVRPRRRGRHRIGTGALARLRGSSRRRPLRPIGGTSFAQCGPRHSSSGTAPVLSCLVPWGTEFPVGRANPPMTTAGMTLVAVDATGRLSEFHAVPSPCSTDAPANLTDWSKLLRRPGCSTVSSPRPSPRSRRPTTPTSGAREGPLPDRPEHTIRVEAAATAGRPVYFALAGPWSRSSPERQPRHPCSRRSSPAWRASSCRR